MKCDPMPFRPMPPHSPRTSVPPRRPQGGAFLALILVAMLAPAAHGQAPGAPTPSPRPEDVSSLDGIMQAVYESISGPAGAPRDWDRFRTLFAPGARLIPTSTAPDGTTGLQVWTPEDFIEQAGPGLVREGFFETEIGRSVERFGPVVHLMSAYDSRRRAEDPEPFMRGVNSFQLLDDGSRWWVVTIFWANETPERPVPDALVQGPR